MCWLSRTVPCRVGPFGDLAAFPVSVAVVLVVPVVPSVVTVGRGQGVAASHKTGLHRCSFFHGDDDAVLVDIKVVGITLGGLDNPGSEA